jgi:hypothetical protein
VTLITGYRPHNSWLRRGFDTRMRPWLTGSLVGAAAVSLLLTAIVAPRQTTVRLRYEIAQETRAVERLEREQRRLTIELEQLSSPAVLAAELPRLELVPVAPERIAHLRPNGELVFAKPPVRTVSTVPRQSGVR